MRSSVLTAKGQTTIPLAIREKLSLEPGDRILYLEDNEKVRIVAADKRAKDLKGLLPKPSRPVSLEEMDAAIATGRSGRPRE